MLKTIFQMAVKPLKLYIRMMLHALLWICIFLVAALLCFLFLMLVK